MKTCNCYYNCSFKVWDTAGLSCKYDGYCDYSTPRDSRHIALQTFCSHEFSTVYTDGTRYCVTCWEKM